jgi:hypothetical protein
MRDRNEAGPLSARPPPAVGSGAAHQITGRALDEGGGAEERVRANMSRSQYRIQLGGLLQLAKIALALLRAIAITIPSAQ